ncbi:hypothetical protein Mapa_012926 [Marchantia paleacea]|nr:hypothetical protein Mapa_012926 [Marchantia paleacea]
MLTSPIPALVPEMSRAWRSKDDRCREGATIANKIKDRQSIATLRNNIFGTRDRSEMITNLLLQEPSLSLLD